MEVFGEGDPPKGTEVAFLGRYTWAQAHSGNSQQADWNLPGGSSTPEIGKGEGREDEGWQGAGGDRACTKSRAISPLGGLFVRDGERLEVMPLTPASDLSQLSMPFRAKPPPTYFSLYMTCSLNDEKRQ